MKFEDEVCVSATLNLGIGVGLKSQSQGEVETISRIMYDPLNWKKTLIVFHSQNSEINQNNCIILPGMLGQQT